MYKIFARELRIIVWYTFVNIFIFEISLYTRDITKTIVFNFIINKKFI